MSAIYPASEAVSTSRLAIEGAFFAVSTVFIAAAVFFSCLRASPGLDTALVVVYLLALWCLILLAWRWKRPPLVAALAILAAGGFLLWGVATSAVIHSSSVQIAACIVGLTALGSNLDRWTGAVGTLVGYAVARVTLEASPLDPTFALAPLVVAVIVAAYYTLLFVVRRSSHGVRERLERTVHTDIAADERRAFDLRSRALVHDTILSELTALSNMNPGAIAAPVRSSIRLSLELARGDSVDDSRDTTTTTFSDLVGNLRVPGVAVTVTGDPDALSQLSEEVRDALLRAAHQALVNVGAHAGTDTAELSIVRSDRSIVVMIVDNGVGFDEASVPEDRLGFRESIRGRVEEAGGTVRILSSPGSGTSVILMYDLDEPTTR
ncbi:hypothetical protein HDC94_000312 [Leifsonia sp. AK011]|uniref:sensor histidine kinase n=1 Tax=Leifsonia sp. AK011 TaxID=2723075 RepID=UPI0015CC0131|nr:hypothetical protein [Leifsonia sp. AK011]NYF09156.1 hypothetical protein [Leifsonia sp. AK011]